MEGGEGNMPIDDSAEWMKNQEGVDSWFKEKGNPELLTRLTQSIEAVRKIVVEKGEKHEPVLPPSVKKFSDFPLADENFYYCLAQETPDPYALWAIDIEEDPVSYDDSNGMVLRLIKDNEGSYVMLDFYYPKDKKNEVELGTTIIRENPKTHKRETVNFPHRRLSRLSSQELTNADLYLRDAKDELMKEDRPTSPTAKLRWLGNR